MVRNQVHNVQNPLANEANRLGWETGSTETFGCKETSYGEQMKDFIVEITQDLHELQNYYNVSLSKKRVQTIGEYLVERNNELVVRFMPAIFADHDQQAKVDWTLIRSFVKQRQEELRAQWQQLDEVGPLAGDWVQGLVDLCERRQAVTPTAGKHAGEMLSSAISAIKSSILTIKTEKHEWTGSKSSAYRFAQQLAELKNHLSEWYTFYEGYDPVFTWWTSKPWADLSEQIVDYISVIRRHLIGIESGDEDAIVGQPVGREAILTALRSEFIAYSPEELIEIAEKEYKWCEAEAIKASHEMGFGDDWRVAQEIVKNMCVEPGQQTKMVHELAEEAIDYVTTHELVTVPEVAKKYWRMYMMSPARQKVNPFFLGGESIIVSYPTDTMSHEDKVMVMRGNNRPFSRSTVFHELIPGHHLQWHYMSRNKTHRQLFQTPFWTEGWAFYWELILWDKEYPGTPENKLGMLFWRMHRCIRIIFSLKFHLGNWTPQQCIDALVDRVGHERATAEGEVRRSFNGDYGPLYQAGYMLGALQLYSLRKELQDSEGFKEIVFHDRVLMENSMPIELLRALLLETKLEAGHEAKWRFYDLDKDKHTC